MPRHNNKDDRGRVRKTPAAIEREIRWQKEVSSSAVAHGNQPPKKVSQHAIGRLLVNDSATQFDSILDQLRSTSKKSPRYIYAFSDFCDPDHPSNRHKTDTTLLKHIISEAGLDPIGSSKPITLNVTGINESLVRRGIGVNVELEDHRSDYYESGFQVRGEQLRILDFFGIPSNLAKRLKSGTMDLESQNFNVQVGVREPGNKVDLDKVVAGIVLPVQVEFTPVRLFHYGS